MKRLQKVGEQLLVLDQALTKRGEELEPGNALALKFTGLLSTPPKPSNSAEPRNVEDPLGPTVRSQRGFQWLQAQQEFTDASVLFDEISGASELPAWQIAIAKVRFLQAIAFWAGVALSAPDWRPPTVSVDLKRRTVATSKQLLELMEQGVTPSNVVEELSLKNSLRRLIDELSAPAPREYSGPSARQKAILEGLALSLLRIGLAPSQVVTVIDGVALMLGFSPKHRTVQRYVHEANKLRRTS